MADFNQILTPGDVDAGLVNVVVEIPMGSPLKIEWNREKAAFMLDRVEPGIFIKPMSYGFVPQTLDEDGDELDVLVICHEPIPTGVFFEAKILGVMHFVDDDEVDDKLVVVPADDRHSGNLIKTFDDIPSSWLKQTEHHFSHYKDLKKPGSTVVKSWGDLVEAQRVIRDCIERWNNR